MSNIQTGAERMPHDLSHLGFLAGQIGRLITISTTPVIAGDSFEDLTEDDFDFLTSNKVWIATDRSRARRCVEACVYGTLDFVGYPRFPAPVEFIAAVI